MGWANQNKFSTLRSVRTDNNKKRFQIDTVIEGKGEDEGLTIYPDRVGLVISDSNKKLADNYEFLTLCLAVFIGLH